MVTLREYSQKQALLEQLQREVDSYKEDPEFQSSLAFLEELKALQTKYDKSNSDVMDIVNPPASSGGPSGASSSSKGRGGSRKHRSKVFRNPHTGEEVEAKNLLNKRLQEWIEDHGRETVRGWVVQESEAG